MKIISRSARETVSLGKALAKNLLPGDIICLCGDLGSGKTVLTKGIARGLGVKKDEIISPTFVLIREYPMARIPLYHFDLYRLQEEKEILAVGYEEYLFGKGISVIEWAQRLGRLMPQEYLGVSLAVVSERKRRIEFSAVGKRYQQLVKKICP
jgi:tRNA threonylcarbamoyladenosine biosynthesis protein TsaE